MKTLLGKKKKCQVKKNKKIKKKRQSKVKADAFGGGCHLEGSSDWPAGCFQGSSESDKRTKSFH